MSHVCRPRKELCRSLCDKAAERAETLRFNVEVGLALVGDRFVGVAPVMIQMHSGVVCLAPLLVALGQDPHWANLPKKVKQPLLDIAGHERLHASEFVIAAFQQPPSLDWFAKQVVVEMARLLDAYVVGRADPPTPAMPTHTTSTPSKTAAAKSSIDVSPYKDEDNDYNRRQMLQRYFLAGRQSFEGQQSLSCAIDASRVGKKGVTLIAIARGNNAAMWAPPQAFG